jgi:hypothetical protein
MRSRRVEQDYVHRLATARLVRPKVGASSPLIGLLFANSGIEEEIVRRADRLEVLPGRHQDLTDLGYLIAAAAEADLGEARTAAVKIQERGFNRGQNLPEDLAALISQAQK